jgi:hypothetical protein
MTLLNLFSSRARVGSGDAQSDDRTIMLMVVLLLGLVFVPIIGLHVAASISDTLAHRATPPVKPTRG